MPDTITAEERAAIAAYTGPIRVIPRGVSALPPCDYGKGIDWRAQIKAQWAAAGKLKAPEVKRAQTPEEMRAKISAGIIARLERLRGPMPPMERRPGETEQDVCARLASEGRFHREIGDVLGITRHAVYQRLKRMQAAHKVAAE